MLNNILPNDNIYLAPQGFNLGQSNALTLGSSELNFKIFKIFIRRNLKTFSFDLPFENLLDWAKENKRSEEIEEKIHLILSKRMSLHGISFNSPSVMGVVNVTPDSFSDGGEFYLHKNAISHGENLVKHGASIIDIGGQSTRPGSESISNYEESRRIISVIDKLSKKNLISVDTNKSQIMREAIMAGAKIINDISSLTNDKDSVKEIRSTPCGLILMHSQGIPKNMQENPKYNDVILDIFDYFEERIKFCEKHGIDRSRLIIDPGIGFGKTDYHLRRIMKYISIFHSLGCPILLGYSRKSFIARWSKLENEKDRLGGSIASVLWSLSQGIQMYRVHDVKETLQAISIWMHIIETKN
ncbi:MAG: Dihydropteroate synthase [Alphaproteobacteria bacterium MarineAlpha2_Bin1]|nr:MAG: Dihydropteroate synthase [Alphaproteobacteria bacterium MarineAlpha2_Bin1]